MNISADLLSIAQQLEEKGSCLNNTEFTEPLDQLDIAATEVGKSRSDSWLGYFSQIYYENFELPPAGAHFSQEWGLRPLCGGTTGDWRVYTFEEVVKVIYDKAGNPDIHDQKREAEKIAKFFEDARANILYLLSIATEARPNDKFLIDLQEQVEKSKLLTVDDFIRCLQPKGEVKSCDMVANEKGFVKPPHIAVMSTVFEIRQPFIACTNLTKIAQRAASHLTNHERQMKREEHIGTNVFIGHGGSPIWRDLKNFIEDELHLPCDEFNRVSVAGLSIKERLSKMLDEAAIAFLVMTAEDEQADQKLHPRMNVVHEAGLFQGRLGFERGLMLLEEGCEEFSNIHGLVHISFPKGNIKATFEEIRQVLKREGLINNEVDLGLDRDTPR